MAGWVQLLVLARVVHECFKLGGACCAVHSCCVRGNTALLLPRTPPHCPICPAGDLLATAPPLERLFARLVDEVGVQPQDQPNVVPPSAGAPQKLSLQVRPARMGANV